MSSKSAIPGMMIVDSKTEMAITLGFCAFHVVFKAVFVNACCFLLSLTIMPSAR